MASKVRLRQLNAGVRGAKVQLARAAVARQRESMAALVRAFLAEVRPMFHRFPSDPQDGLQRWGVSSARERGVLRDLAPLTEAAAQAMIATMWDECRNSRRQAYVRGVRSVALTCREMGISTETAHDPARVAAKPVKCVVQRRDIHEALRIDLLPSPAYTSSRALLGLPDRAAILHDGGRLRETGAAPPPEEEELFPGEPPLARDNGRISVRVLAFGPGGQLYVLGAVALREGFPDQPRDEHGQWTTSGGEFTRERAEGWERKARKEYGLTKDYAKAGFILRDGSMLDFSQRNRKRLIEHEDIARMTDVEGPDADVKYRFMRETGAIRIGLDPQYKSIMFLELTTAPTIEQARTIERSPATRLQYDVATATGAILDHGDEPLDRAERFYAHVKRTVLGKPALKEAFDPGQERDEQGQWVDQGGEEGASPASGEPKSLRPEPTRDERQAVQAELVRAGVPNERARRLERKLTRTVDPTVLKTVLPKLRAVAVKPIGDYKGKYFSRGEKVADAPKLGRGPAIVMAPDGTDETFLHEFGHFLDDHAIGAIDQRNLDQADSAPMRGFDAARTQPLNRAALREYQKEVARFTEVVSRRQGGFGKVFIEDHPGTPTKAVSHYALASFAEWKGEAFRVYAKTPEKLKRLSPATFRLLDAVAGGKTVS